MTPYLSTEELIELTHRRRPSAQRRALTSMGIDSLVRPDGTLVVLRSSVEAAVGITTPKVSEFRFGWET